MNDVTVAPSTTWLLTRRDGWPTREYVVVTFGLVSIIVFFALLRSWLGGMPPVWGVFVALGAMGLIHTQRRQGIERVSGRGATRVRLLDGTARTAVTIAAPVWLAIAAYLLLIAWDRERVRMVVPVPSSMEQYVYSFGYLAFLTLALPWIISVWRHDELPDLPLGPTRI